jgi:hypothetical protein
MEIDVRLATAQDRKALDQFYAREGKDFQNLTTRSISSPVGAIVETMFVIAATEDMIVAALKLDIGNDPRLGRVGFIKYFEIEDELEQTDLGARMIARTIEIAERKGLKALDTMVPESRQDVISIFGDSGFEEQCREVRLRRLFRTSVFQ